MNEKEIIEKFIADGLVARVGDTVIITNKYNRLLAGQQVPVAKVEKPVPKSMVELKSPDELLKKFIKDANIPFRAPWAGKPGKTYTIAARSKEAIKRFYEILCANEYEYEDMVFATKTYYSQDSYKFTLTRFIMEGMLDMYTESYVKHKGEGTLATEFVQPNNTNKTSI